MSLNPLFVVALSSAVAASACAVGPNYKRPSTVEPTSYRENSNWKPGQPSAPSLDERWWGLFHDPVLNDLEAKVAVSNQNLVAAAAAYRQARAILRENGADLFPSFSASGSDTRSGGSRLASSRYQAGAAASWAPDVWGRIRRTIEASRAQAVASADDLAGATLSAQAELALNYIQLRAAEEQGRLLQLSFDGDQESLRISRNRYEQGTIGRGDVASTESQLATIQAEIADLERQRAQFEHAIALLIGSPPEDVALPAAAWTMKTPDVPVVVPSALLERRPDVAAAERRVAAANAQVGVAVSAYFPDITLTGSYGGAASKIGAVFDAPSRVWSLGGSLAETVIDFGHRKAAADAARASYDAAVANYREIVLAAFKGVDDALVAARVLEDVERFRATSAASAAEAERIALNQYQAGVIDHTALIVAQNAAHDARIAALTSSLNRLTAAVSLIQALGGGWSADSPLPTK